MARKATDLLDVFRFGDDGGDDDTQREKARGGRAASKKKKKKAKKKAAAKSSRSGFEELVLNRRQVVLGSSAIVLLLVLSFVLGLSTGRSGPSRDDTAIERRAQTTKVAIRGDLPSLDPATRKSIDPAAVAAILKRDYGLRRGNLRMYRADGRIVIEIGPFSSEAQARDYLRKSGLEMLHLHMADPFRWPKFTPWKKDG